jgi:hypothetical protein
MKYILFRVINTLLVFSTPQNTRERRANFQIQRVEKLHKESLVIQILSKCQIIQAA